jgi:hypothetical protein
MKTMNNKFRAIATHTSLLTLCLLLSALSWYTMPAPSAQEKMAAAAQKGAPRILFIGNSFTFGAGTPVMGWRSNTVTDLNGNAIGGVPAIFKAFVTQARRDFDVSLETSPGRNLEFHLREKAGVIGQSWDYVLLQGHSLLDKDKPGDATTHARAAKGLAELLRGHNPKADIRLVATWSRADQTYPKEGYWYGQPIEKMALDIRRGYDLALQESAPLIRQVIPVGEAWNRAIKTGVADPNPYDGLTPGQLNLWGRDHYHASVAGYYLEALMIFGAITEIDPRSLGREEHAASELGLTPEQAAALQKTAHEELRSLKKQRRL